MVSKAFVLIETVRGKSKEVNAVLKHIEGIISADNVTPPYDIIAIAKGESFNNISDMVSSRIHSIAGVTRAVTCATMRNPAGTVDHQQYVRDMVRVPEIHKMTVKDVDIVHKRVPVRVYFNVPLESDTKLEQGVRYSTASL